VSGSIAWQNEDLYVCGEGGLVRISVRDGSWESGGAPCSGVASYRGGLLVNRWFVGEERGPFDFLPPLAWFPTYQAVLSGQPERTFSLGDRSATMTVQGEKLYTAWHAGKSVEVSDLGKGEVIGVLTLENYNGWMLGMSVTEDGYLVLSGEPWGRTVYVFDAYDGKEVKRFDERLPGGSGLACVANASITPRDTPTPTATPPAATPTATPCDADFEADFDDCPDPCAGLESDPSPFRLHELPPSTPIEMNCLDGGYRSSNYAPPEEVLTPGATEELACVQRLAFDEHNSRLRSGHE